MEKERAEAGEEKAGLARRACIALACFSRDPSPGRKVGYTGLTA